MCVCVVFVRVCVVCVSCSRWAKSTVEWKTMTTYWSFLIIHVVFVSTFGGTLSKILSEFIDNPRSLSPPLDLARSVDASV